MSAHRLGPQKITALKARYGDQLQINAPLAPYTSARIGGPADALLVVDSSKALLDAAEILWDLAVPFMILGGGSNVLVADQGFRGCVLLNHARMVRFEEMDQEQYVWAESGASFGSLARRAVDRGWSGLEWAVTIPGTVGGAVVGNAGAHGGDVAGALAMAEILQPGIPPEPWPVERLEYAYRSSWLKRNPGQAVVLAAQFQLEQGSRADTKALAGTFVSQRQATQPSGASWGSMFKNPPGESAGKLIEAAGYKGYQVGAVQVSEKHANFFINLGGATAVDVLALIRTVQAEVFARFGVQLELEIALVGEWCAEEAENYFGGKGV